MEKQLELSAMPVAFTGRTCKVLNKEIPLQHIESYTYAHQIITDEGFGAIRYYVYEKFAQWVTDDFDREWVIAKGEYSGTFPKRISSYLFKKFQIRMARTDLEMIGNIARANCTEPETVYFDFTDQFDWEAGDFGDEGSCYWGSHEEARQMLDDHNALAVRFYKKYTSEWDGETSYKGFGRAWMIIPSTADDTTYKSAEYHLLKAPRDIAIVYNNYPKGVQLVRTARILATYFGSSYCKIRLHNNEDDSGMLYINGGTGYLLGASKAIENIAHVDLQWEDEDSIECEGCGCRMAEDSTHRTDGGDTYCLSCYSDIYTSCARCNTELVREDVPCVVQGEDYCELCVARYAFECSVCNKWSRNEYRAGHLASDEPLCDDCADNAYTECACCDYYKPDDDVQEIVTQEVDYPYRTMRTQRVDICDDCISKYYTNAQDNLNECAQCHCAFRVHGLINLLEQGHCDFCSKQIAHNLNVQQLELSAALLNAPYSS